MKLQLNTTPVNYFTGFSSMLILTFCMVFASMNVFAQQANTGLPKDVLELKVLPSVTDSRITSADVAHLVWYNPNFADFAEIPQGKLLLFLPGTNGIPERGPKKLFAAAIEQGYHVINLSYINKQAVARICRGENLAKDSDCTEKFRTQRVFGTPLMTLIPDKPQDAIINRFEKLLSYLAKTDKNGNWDAYLKNGKPDWSVITVAGQSQGGGMAAFIAKKIDVNRIITFSGGWDFSAPKKIAKWYSNEWVTPSERWFGAYHSKEPMANTIDETYKAMGIPEQHIYRLDKPIREGKKAHGEGIRNTVYSDMWETLFSG